MPAERSALVGVDIGTSAAKVLASTFEGKIVASASASYPLETPRPGYVEQDAEEVYRATMKALHDVLAEVGLRGDRVLALGFSSAMHGVLPVDERGEPLGRLVTWMDRRAAEIAERWNADGTARALYGSTGAPMHPMLPSCKLRWFAENEPEVIRRAAKVVSMKELFIFRWTGEWLVDWGIASATGLFDLQSRDWNARALELARVERTQLSQAVQPSTTLRTLRQPVASALGLGDAAIVLASSDGALANLGVGAVGPGELALTLGTSGAIRMVVERPALDAQGRTFCYAFDDRRFIAGGPTSSAGAVLNKIQELFAGEIPVAERFNRAIELAEGAPPGANGLTVLPFLSGERAPYWLAELRGGLLGLDLAHTRADVFRASFESVVFALATVLDVLRESTGAPARVRLSGGLTRAALVRQLVADVFGCQAALADQEEASAFGAAMMAGIAVGALAGPEAVAALLEPLHVHEPQPAMVARYAEIFARYRACVEATLPLYAKPPQPATAVRGA
ncbi:MAG: gluconokinase [Vulcanimicrobiaceae bacterium]